MVSQKLKNILLIAVILILLHVIEEVATGFQYNDSFFSFFASFLINKTEAFYVGFHIMWITVVLVGFLLVTNYHRWVFPLLILFGTIFIIELHHVAKAIIFQRYYPGMITGLFYPVIGYFYWKELLHNLKINHK